ncbi:bifunctional 2-C-methyl-D-erythritol 4-phosphate cytidylyltransferase/2-C-methyl-D-erythritol 2,4-cyclodiphosphate synthase [Rhizobiales bacterium TNE-4]|nr:bifunctional 2-C-methyl-D-erythritol 4-phosphate cytidylyltransferase/2-C-methyl-D-erythritol 2,4-cyclodiphosphate synthase [Rhizobiales bacterium TNE-4]MBV1826910.1 bifunctional 2-C-methyl-D-erythritol 4-phosphate cytidylyltransferase/2-C-methyl-D-erythritol 2,4-cyclodiphosphate synthase [Rhizobiales bacterium TNE-4]
MSIIALIVAAGRGERAGQAGPKQYARLAGETVLARSIKALGASKRIDGILCVIHADDRALYDDAMKTLSPRLRKKLREPVTGGATRQHSVMAGLEALTESQCETVLIHDAARPFVSKKLIDRIIDAVPLTGAAVPTLPMIDTVKELDRSGFITKTPDRSRLRAVQTPQAFTFKLILGAHRALVDREMTDDASLVEALGGPVTPVDGERRNVKLTTPEDFAVAELNLTETVSAMGYDVHAFGEGDHVTLAGIKIPHTRGILAHSDGDVILHALCDAIFGAIGAGDIGQHFPPSDPQWKDAPSSTFVAQAIKLLKEQGGSLVNCDVTVLAEEPRIGKHRDAMIESLAGLTGLRKERIGLKATTTEKLGAVGRGEGLVAQVLCTLRLPREA